MTRSRIRMAFRLCFPIVLMALAGFGSSALAATCGPGSASVKDLRTSVEDGENSADSTVYLTGYVENRCPNIIAVTVTIAAEKADGTIIAKHSFDIDGIPAGGQSFDLTGAIPYDAAVEVYDVTGVAVRDLSVNAGGTRARGVRAAPAYQPPPYTGSLTPGD